MVYESDFYTTRRPYSRPTISSYSVTTPLRVIPGVSRVYSYSSYAPIMYHTIPHYSYYRSLPTTLYLPSAVPLRYYTRSSPVRVVTSPLRDYSPPRIFSVSVRPSVIHRELMRIEHKTRPRYGYDPTDEFLNSVHAKEFEDDIRHLRTETSRVLSRVHTPLPRGRRAVSCSPYLRDSSVTTDREFLEHLRGVPRPVKDDIFTLSRYAEPARRHVGLDRFRPSRKFSAPRPLEDPNAELKAKKAARANKLANFNETDEIELEKIRAKRQADAQAQEAKLAQMEKEKQEEQARKIEAARRKALEDQEREKAQLEAEEKARQEAEEKARQKAAEKARLEAEEKARQEAEEKARLEAEEQARLEAEEQARLEAEERARLEAEELAKLEAEEQARIEAEEKAKQEAEEKARREAEELARQHAEEQARLDAEAEAQRIEEETLRLHQIENAAKEEREAELARQAAELIEIAKLEAEALRLMELEQVASELEQPLENSQSTNADTENLASEEIGAEPLVEEPLTPAAVEDTKEDISEAHATVEDTTGANAEVVTDDEVEPIE